jgi:ATP phosphoribosyltransferase
MIGGVNGNGGVNGKLVLGIPSKGRLMESTAKVLAEAGMELRKVGHERGYRGELLGVDNVDVTFISASEIAHALRTGKIHLGVTGEDLIREEITDAEQRVSFIKKLGFGHANVVVAVPKCWIDVRRMLDLDEVATRFRRMHQRRLRVATKYMNLTRRYFSASGVSDYRIVESLGATEGTPASGTADLIVDITSSGETLRANGLKVLEDGIILRSEANLIASKTVKWSPESRSAENEIFSRLGV